MEPELEDIRLRIAEIIAIRDECHDHNVMAVKYRALSMREVELMHEHRLALIGHSKDPVSTG